MAKGVLGNDPFQRGAATRAGDGGKAAADDASAKPANKGGAKKAPAKTPARAKAGGGAKAASAKGAKAGGGATAASMKAASAHAGSGKASATKPPVDAKAGSGRDASTPTKQPAAAKTGGSAGKVRKEPAAHEAEGAMASELTPESSNREPVTAGAKRNGGTREQQPGAGTAHTGQTSAPVDDDAGLPLREPAAPVSPRKPPPPRKPVLAEEPGARTERQREVDHALAEALAAEVAEATARAAVDEALDRRPGEEQDADRLMATEMATELAGAAVEQVLGHSPPSQRPERERELAAAVAAQVAEAAAEVAVAEVLDRHANAKATSTLTEDGELEERAADAYEGADGAGYDLEAEAEGGFGPSEDDEEEEEDAEGTSPWDTSGLELSVTLSVQDPEDRDASTLEPEEEVPDASRDELPLGRRTPLSLVPPTDEGSAPREPFFTDQAREPEGPRPLAQRAAGMLSLARDIAGHALASQGLGRAMGAMNGLVDALRAGLGTGGGTSIDEYGKDPSLVERLDPVLEFLYSQYWRVLVQGVDHVPQGAAILVANHSGALPYDGLVMSLAISRERPDLREPRWLVEDQVFHAPVLGTLFNRLGAVRACPENALRLLDEHRPLVVFPEGYQALSKPFAERYRLKRFGRGGFVKLALRTGAPIVPVAIVGAEETSPLLGRLPASFLGLPYVPLTPLGPLPLPAKWSIRFGEPLGMEGLPPEAADDPGEVQRITERTRESIMGMLQSLLRERRSVFAG
ncbi:lysophospholipid acyltransferase family protein [Pyxidicoccus sp. MSG2]|uniref:lysophospholipid acyltransferase family protein n=1 Tax=Pyxidicoccus sp. MSG2 TaxID=2996790 RepID=UPI00226E8548|nr:lysophospholipid acyltransferase family protein [Pyxidicoccus sp. MSG2]MCY1022883.1 lysophospholipid acyltransferase family protein [Pyxidicoccus sp. MSG2]